MAAKLSSSYRMTDGIWVCELNQMWDLVRSVCFFIFAFFIKNKNLTYKISMHECSL